MKDNDDFKVLTYKVIISEHPNADRLEIAHILDYEIIVPKGEFETGEIVAYIPIDSVLPYDMIESMGLTGHLGGDRKHRVRLKKIRGVLSYGLIYKTDKPIGVDVKDELGIIKYQDEHYQDMFVGRGDIPNYAEYMPNKTLIFRIKNIKKRPYMFQDGDDVIITEKVHGRSLCVGMYGDLPIITDKRLSYRALVLIDNHNNKDNVKMQVGKKILPYVQEIQRKYGLQYVYLFGEVYGKHCQSMDYGLDTPDFMAFDLFIGKPETGDYVCFDQLTNMVSRYCKHVPVIYRGKYKRTLVNEMTIGKSVLFDGDREGVVVKAAYGERRVIKSVSPEFLLYLHSSDWE